MPTRQHPGVRRSRRHQGIAHNLLELPVHTNQNASSRASSKKKKSTTKEVIPTSRNSKELDEAYVPSVDSENLSDEEEVLDEQEDTKKHPCKNYTKPVLYDKWKKAVKECSEQRNLCMELQKDLKTLNRRIAFLQKEVQKTETLELKVSSLQDKLKDSQEKASTLSTSKSSSNAVTKKMLDSMKATYDSLCTKKDYEHKSTLCNLELKFKETELKFNAKEEENKRLKDEINS